MARTPLARRIAGLAAVHAEAGGRGIPPQAVRAERLAAREAPMAIKGTRIAVRNGALPAFTRRRFLAGSAAAGLSLALGPGLVRAGIAGLPPAARLRIGIIGAGIAGLSAALTLADAGVDAMVFEASNRVGGRMHSDADGFPDARGQWLDGQISEWCGELIDTGHQTIRGLARRFGLKTVDLIAAQPRHSEDTYYFDGGYVRQADLDALFAPVNKALQADLTAADYPTTYASSTPAGAALDRLSLYDWIETRVPGGHSSVMGQLLDAAYTTEYGAATRDQSSLNLVYLLGFGATPRKLVIFGQSDERFHISGGNERLPAAMAAVLPAGRVHLQWRMAAIASNADGSVTLTFDTPGGSRSQTFDRVILTLPFAVLRTLDDRRAGFDARKKAAITQLGAGRNAKLMLQFDERIWTGQGDWPGTANGNAWSDIGVQLTWDVTRGQPGRSGILVNYAGGDAAAALKPPTARSDAASSPRTAQYARAFLDQIEPIYPGLTGHWNQRATLSVPALDPNLNLAYSYWRVGQYTQFGGYEGARQRNILFAGEHTSQDFQGFMEGGASEGVRAARDLLAE